MRRSVIATVAALVSVGVAATAIPSTGIGATGGPAPASSSAGTGDVHIDVLSNRADLISGGDALVEVQLPAGADDDLLRVSVDGIDVTDAFERRADGRLVGLVEGLAVGDNELLADLRPNAHSDAPPGRSSARITITNHPIGGPIFSGPHLQPWLCTTVANGLGDAVDDDCNAPTRIDWFYRAEGGNTWLAYDPADPPANVATTTTDQGETVPFVVRRERGTMNRGIYDVAVLSDPTADWEPWTPQPGWNGKIVWPFGASSGTVHSQGSPQSVLNATRLGQGFMVATASLNVHGSNLNTVVSAESVMMLKEHITETYGPIRYVIGTGGSGGSIQQHQIANTYPGLIDGLLPTLSYPDTWTTGTEVTGCMTVVPALNAAGVTNTAQRVAVFGHATSITCTLFPLLFGAGADPTVGCGLPQELVFHPDDNPDGVRCTASDYMKNVWGIDPDTGYARIAGTIIGVQYGLNALLAGTITPEQFVAINEAAASVFSPPGVRVPSDPGATEIAYRTGQVNDGVNLDQVPIIDVRQNGNNEFHTNYHTWALRERMVRSNGHHDNHVIFWSSTTSVPAVATAEAFALMDAWLTAIEADTSDDPLDEKVRRHRPDEAIDTCWLSGVRHTDYDFCLEQAPYFGAPNIAAGLPTSHDNIECQTKPLDPADYPDVTFTDDQWARLGAAFPTGVCDASLPPVDVTPTVPWLTYAAGPGGVPIGDAPVSTPGCAGHSHGQGNAAGGGCPGRP